MELRLISVTPGPPKRLWTIKPPTNAPAIPIKIVTMIPPGSGPGMTHLASTPAMSPIAISATMPMRFHLPLTHYLLPPDDTRKRNITDAVRHATNARLTPELTRINTYGGICSGLLRREGAATRATRRPRRRAGRRRRAADGPPPASPGRA